MMFLKWFHNNNYNTNVKLADDTVYVIEFHEGREYQIRFVCFQNNIRLFQHECIIVVSCKDFEELFKKSK